MPLNVTALRNGLEQVASNPPTGRLACASAWANAVAAWATGIVPPSSTVVAARAALQTALAIAFSTTSAAAPMELAFTTFAATVGGGMAGYVPTPPPGSVGFASLFAVDRTSHADAATAVANAIDAWMRTGIATLAVPPNTVVPWS